MSAGAALAKRERGLERGQSDWQTHWPCLLGGALPTLLRCGECTSKLVEHARLGGRFTRKQPRTPPLGTRGDSTSNPAPVRPCSRVCAVSFASALRRAASRRNRGSPPRGTAPRPGSPASSHRGRRHHHLAPSPSGRIYAGATTNRPACRSMPRRGRRSEKSQTAG